VKEEIKIVDKRAKREAAIKRARHRSIIKLAVVSLIVVAIVIFGVLYFIELGNNREYVSSDNQMIRLSADGSFAASLAHEIISGTYTESTANGITTIIFLFEGASVQSTITDNVLLLPAEWDDDHGHEKSFTLR
jgi:hypothetical protein